MLKPDVDSLVPHVPFDRRTFLKTALGSGFAAAVRLKRWKVVRGPGRAQGFGPVATGRDGSAHHSLHEPA